MVKENGRPVAALAKRYGVSRGLDLFDWWDWFIPYFIPS